MAVSTRLVVRGPQLVARRQAAQMTSAVATIRQSVRQVVVASGVRLGALREVLRTSTAVRQQMLAGVQGAAEAHRALGVVLREAMAAPERQVKDIATAEGEAQEGLRRMLAVPVATESYYCVGMSKG